MFSDAKIYDLDEIAENRSLRDFLLIVKSIDSKFNSIHTINLLRTAHVSTTMKQMHDLVEKFRHTIRMSGGSKVKITVRLFEGNQLNHLNAYAKKSIDSLNVFI